MADADEHSGMEAHDNGDEVNGTSSAADTGIGASLKERLERDRAAFLAGDLGDDAGLEKADKKKAAKASRDSSKDDDDQDDDADLDDDGDDEDEKTDVAADDDEEETADEDDDDSDLDDDDDEKAKAPGADDETKKRLEQVRRTDKRLREKREADFKSRETELRKIETGIEERWKSRVEKAENFEKLAARAKTHAADVLIELGLTDDDLEHAARDIYAHSKKGAEDPKNKEAALRARAQREKDERIAALEKRLNDREKTEAEKQQEAEQRKAVDAHLDRFASVAKKNSERYPLANNYLAKNPQGARADLEVVAGRLAQQLGAMPSEKDVIRAFEKDRRRVLREHGIDPKKFVATSATTDDAKKTDKKTDTKTGDQTTANQKSKPNGEVKRLTKADYIAGKFD
jgi:hypothetical protein